jgi:hypothetical protein
MIIIVKKTLANEPDLSNVNLNHWTYEALLNPNGQDYTVNLNWISPVPFSITPAQAREQLWKIGLRQQVQDYVEQNARMLDWWEYALEIRRTNEYIEQMRIQLNWTNEQLDEFFIMASKIE